MSSTPDSAFSILDRDRIKKPKKIHHYKEINFGFNS